MGQLTLTMQQHNGITCIADIDFTEADCIKKLEDLISKRMTSLSVAASFKDGQCVNIHVDDKDLKKIIKQGYLYAAFTLDKNKIPAGFTGYKFYGLKIS